MTYPVVIRPAAAADIESARDWYNRARPGLGDEFLTALDDTLRRVREAPDQYPAVHRGIRRALLKRFPYGVFFRFADDTVLVIACFHGRRNPTVWRSRTVKA